MFSLFHDSWNAFPTFVLLDHTMTVRAKPWTLSSNSNSNSCDGNNNTIDGWSGGSTADFIQQLLDECGSLCEPNSDSDNDGILTNEDNCPNDYNPDQTDIDNDDIGDVCDDCYNMSGDVNNDTAIDVLDIVSIVNIILSASGGTDCEIINSDLTGDDNINILDVIQIINIILGT